MAGVKDLKDSQRRSSLASSISSKSIASRVPDKVKGADSTPSRRSSISIASSTASDYALSHTLSSSSQFVDPLKRVKPFRIDRIDALELRRLGASEHATPARLLVKDESVKEDTNYYPKSFVLPAISNAMALHFDVNVQVQASATKRRLFVHLDSCRRRPNDKMDEFLRACYIRLTQIGRPEQAYLKLPPCFYLSEIRFDMGLQSGFATFAWLCFDDKWVRRTIRSALVTSIAGSLARWRGDNDCECDIGCYCIMATMKISYNKAVSGGIARVTSNVRQNQVDSSKAFPTWLDRKGYQAFQEWCGKPEVTKKGGVPHLKNFQAKDIRLNYFGDVVRLELIRVPGAPTSLPEPQQPAPAKKKGLFRGRR